MKTIIISLIISVFIVSCGKSGHIDSELHQQSKLIGAKMVASPNKRWENNKILIISFLDGTPEQKAEVELFAKEWTRYANINFSFYPTLKDIPRRKSPDILITFIADVNTSSVGIDAKTEVNDKKSSMRLGSMKNPIISLRRFVVLHEFGHVLGLQHEHQHPERNFKLSGEEGVKACMKVFSSSLNEEGCRLHVVKTIEKSDNVYLSKYDPNSVMHYTFRKEVFDGKAETRQNDSLSLLDKLEIANFYPGRMKKNKIIELHQSQQDEIARTQIYKNCKIVEKIITQNRFNESGEPQKLQLPRYSVESLTEGEFKVEGEWDDKEGTIVLMKNTKYCNYSAAEVEDLRTKVKEERLRSNQYGNCAIALDENAKPLTKSCTNKPGSFEVRKTKTDEIAISLCFNTFNEAIVAQKKEPYCNFNSEELAAYEKKKMDASKIILCTIKNTPRP
ncbi:MAG: hypothetical protein K2Q18_06575, partial [Bdellovibrionales bacterium]|nr:hypothetical protein [Bdellovibrionales bacterium]